MALVKMSLPSPYECVQRWTNRATKGMLAERSEGKSGNPPISDIPYGECRYANVYLARM